MLPGSVGSELIIPFELNPLLTAQGGTAVRRRVHQEQESEYGPAVDAALERYWNSTELVSVCTRTQKRNFLSFVKQHRGGERAGYGAVHW